MKPGSYTAFIGGRKLAAGPLAGVALSVKAAEEAGATEVSPPIFVFDDATGKLVDLDLRGSDAEILARLPPTPAEEPPSGRGRPRLGVVAREVTLLPRHWDWLATRPGGASNALRRLVEEAMRRDNAGDRARMARDAAYRFMSAMAGDLPGFEEAARALYADNGAGFRQHAGGWPPDIAAHARALAWPDGDEPPGA